MAEIIMGSYVKIENPSERRRALEAGYQIDQTGGNTVEYIDSTKYIESAERIKEILETTP